MNRPKSVKPKTTSRRKQCLLQAGILFAVIVGTTFCTYKKPATEEPAPNRARIHKSFFATRNSPAEVRRTGQLWRSKRFLCGWVAEDTAGVFAHAVNDHFNFSQHCNMEFDITQDALVGRLVNPSFPDQPSRWPVVLTIPITRHYYVERRRDNRGRDTNEEIENSDRSDFEARPFIDINLRGLDLRDHMAQPFWGGMQVQMVSDVEMDPRQSFLGFTLTAQSSVLQSMSQARLRFNFLAFDSDRDFTARKRTLYHPVNSRHFNVLHVLGRRVDGVDQEMYAAKWDLDKRRDVHLVDFPPEYQDLGHEIVRQWNDVFEKISGKRPFVSKVVARKHHFDLRHTSLVWVQDRRMSENGPLGVGLVAADVTNGEILWGSAVVWGGAIERYLRAYQPAGTAPPTSAHAVFAANFQTAPPLQLSFALPSFPGRAQRVNPFPRLSSQGMDAVRAQIQQRMAPRLQPDGAELTPEDRRQIQTETERLLQSAEQLSSSAQVLPLESTADAVQDLLGQPRLSQSLANLPAPLRSRFDGLSPQQLARALPQVLSQPTALWDLDRTFTQLSVGWRLGQSLPGARPVERAIRTVVKDLLLHEMGHMIGLGHNFKENILPRRGSVPHVHQAKLEADHDRGHLNYSSVMGYKHGVTDMLMDESEIAPGPHDELVLRYLYRQQVATYVEGEEDFVFAQLPVDGRIGQTIRHAGRQRPVSYFPQCNDMAASLAVDPYCNRWDRGSTAVTLVQNYFQDFRGSMVAQLQSFSPDVQRHNADMMKYILFDRSIMTFGRARLFYDYMRQNYASVLRQQVLAGGTDAERRVLDFSTACAIASGEDKALERQGLVDFLKRPENGELRDLCQATNIYLRELQEMIQIPGGDFTEFDRKNRIVMSSMTGGDVRLGNERFFGAWREMAREPLRIAALYQGLLPYPLLSFYGWLIPAPDYMSTDGFFHLSTLYPREYTQLIASATEANLSLGSLQGSQSTRLGRSVLALGYLLPMSSFTNDKFDLDPVLANTIRSQTSFNFSFAVVDVTKKEEPGREIARRFTGNMYGLFGGSRTETLAEVYLYTRDRVIAVPPPGVMMLPITPIRWFSANSGYYYVMRVDYPLNDPSDTLRARSVRTSLDETYREILRICTQGPGGDTPIRNGLRYFFNDSVPESVFPGFLFGKSIHVSDGDRDTLFRSVQEQFERYYRNDLPEGHRFDVAPDPRACSEALRGQSLLVSTAAALTGYQLAELFQFIELGN